MGAGGRSTHRHVGLLIVVIATAMAGLTAQAVTVSTAGGALRVHAPAFAFIEGVVLERLRDGRSVPLELTLAVLARRSGPAVIETRQVFNLSFDLWEERVAVSRVGAPPRSVSHLRPPDAETWCLENLTVPVADIARRGRDQAFWLRLEYQVLDQTPASERDGDSTFTLRRLIDVLSQQREASQLRKSIEAGPFRLSN